MSFGHQSLVNDLLPLSQVYCSNIKFKSADARITTDFRKLSLYSALWTSTDGCCISSCHFHMHKWRAKRTSAVHPPWSLSILPSILKDNKQHIMLTGCASLPWAAAAAFSFYLYICRVINSNFYLFALYQAGEFLVEAFPQPMMPNPANCCWRLKHVVTVWSSAWHFFCCKTCCSLCKIVLCLFSQSDEVLTVIKAKAQWPAWQPLNV